jgi:signal transduction histidine kinase
MFLDLTALGLIVYYTGSIETPLFMLFVFHMIIGSLILPGRIIYSIALFVILWFNTLVFGEYFGIIPHHEVAGLINFHLYDNLKFIIAYDVIFSFSIIVSVMLANKIANQLYKIEQQLVESFDKLEEAEKEKQKYIIGLVHEIKSPLAVVHSYLELILQKYLGPISKEVEDRISRALASSNEAINMINNVLKVSNLRLLNEITINEVDVKKIISNLVTKQYENIKEKRIDLKIHDFRKEKKIIKGDEMLLEIAFSNLIGNAIKYVDMCGIIEILLRDKNGDTEIEICDNGIGIPEKDIGKIFNDFYRASNIKQKKYEGSGLGLSIVKHIIERHGGTISVISPSRIGTAHNPGTSFFITLHEEKAA